MNALIVLIATTALGIEVGWEPLPGGGHEYTLQIEPQLLKVLEAGQQEVFSEVPTGVDVRRYRIVVGVGKLRRDYGPLVAEIEQPPANAGTPPPGSTGVAPTSPTGDPYQESRDALGALPPATGLETVPPATAPPVTAPAATPDSALPAAPAGAPEFPATEPASTNHPAAGAATPANDPWHDSVNQPVSEGKAEQITIDSAAAAKMADAPAKLPESKDPSTPIRNATFEDGKSTSGVVDTGRPQLPETDPKPQPWAPLVVTIVLLACSLGGNIFLGWIAADARARYRNAVAKLRGAAA